MDDAHSVPWVSEIPCRSKLANYNVPLSMQIAILCETFYFARPYPDDLAPGQRFRTDWVNLVLLIPGLKHARPELIPLGDQSVGRPSTLKTDTATFLIVHSNLEL